MASGAAAALHGEGEPVPRARARVRRCARRAWSRSRASRRARRRSRRSPPPRRWSSTAEASSSTPRERSRATPTCGPCAARPARCGSRSKPASRSSRWRTGARRRSCRATASSACGRCASPSTVAIGDPVDLSDLAGQHGRPAALNEATNRLMNAITALLEDLRDEKAPAERWDPSVHGQKETGRIEPRSDPPGRSSLPRVAVIGAGSWGTTFGKILADGGAHVTMWARRPELAQRDQRGQAQQRVPARHQPAARDVGDPPPVRGPRGRGAGVPVDPEPGRAPEPQGRAPARGPDRCAHRLAHEGRRATLGTAHEPGHRAGARTAIPRGSPSPRAPTSRSRSRASSPPPPSSPRRARRRPRPSPAARATPTSARSSTPMSSARSSAASSRTSSPSRSASSTASATARTRRPPSSRAGSSR